MCIIVSKPTGIAFPPKRTLKTCFNNNPDGAGYMYADGDGYVHIRKGFSTFKEFWHSLAKSRRATGDNVAYVMHFRISTQAHGMRDCTHPFPLSSKMDDLRKLSCKAKMGVAHNGIISLTSSYNKAITYSDTMLFITDYLSHIIINNNATITEHQRALIDKLTGSRLAIMDGQGNITLTGNGWIYNNDIAYSNGSYEEYKPKRNNYIYNYGWDYPSYDDDFDDEYCDDLPCYTDDVFDCTQCKYHNNCVYECDWGGIDS